MSSFIMAKVESLPEYYWKRQSINDNDFRKLSDFIQANLGIRMPYTKKIMLESRLQKRLRMLSMTSFREYCDFLFTREGIEKELVYFFDVVTTNKTDFFREPSHFEFLIREIIPELVDKKNIGIRRNMNIWSAGCSTGEEPYTLSMLLNDFKEKVSHFKFSVIASDISRAVLDKAQLAIYPAEKLSVIPDILKRKYILKSKDKDKKLIRIAPSIRSHVQFHMINLLEAQKKFRSTFDIIFCRNVLIYFDRDIQLKVLHNLYNSLRSGGYIFLGHSETICGIDIPLRGVCPTVYRKD